MTTTDDTGTNILRAIRADVDDDLEQTLAREGVPKYMREGLIKYLRWGIRPGHFLLSVLENDYMEACAWADGNNAAALATYARVLYAMPSMCYGSPAKVAAWIDRGDKSRANS